jgi:hypothetical protein
LADTNTFEFDAAWMGMPMSDPFSMEVFTDKSADFLGFEFSPVDFGL